MERQMLLHTTNDSNYFEGWYYRINYNEKKLVVIIGITNEYAFLQLFNENYEYEYIQYNLSEFYYDSSIDSFYLGKNVFSDQKLHLLDEKLSLKAKILFYRPQKLKTSKYIPTIMGPFSYLKKMECNHGVIFMNATIGGYIQVNNQCTTLNGQAYLEKDWGSSFPSKYVWMQANDKNESLFVAVATIPVLMTSFQGVLFVYKTMGKEYLFASYLGAKVTYLQHDEQYSFIEIKQGKKIVSIKVEKSTGCTLQAPKFGKMNETVVESLDASIEFMIRKGNAVLETRKFENAGFECREGL